MTNSSRIDEQIWSNFVSRCETMPEIKGLIPALKILFSHNHPPPEWDEDGNMKPCQECVDMLMKAIKEEGL